MSIGIPEALKLEHQALHAELVTLTEAPGPLGEAARRVADLLHPHFVKEEEYALPPLGLLASLAQGVVSDEMQPALAMTERLRKELPEMLAEHRAVVGALQALVDVARAEDRADAVKFAEELRLHAETEEQVLYPAAILVGEHMKYRLGSQSRQASTSGGRRGRHEGQKRER